jgi:hypothetical protein
MGRAPAWQNWQWCSIINRALPIDHFASIFVGPLAQLVEHLTLNQ